MSTVVLYCWCHSDITSFLLYFTFFHTCSLCRVELVVQFPASCSTQVLLCLFPGVLWLWHFLYSVGPHPVSGLHIYTFVVSRAFMACAASQSGDADSSRAPGLTSVLQGVRECSPWCSIVGATVTLHQFFYILHWNPSYIFCLKISYKCSTFVLIGIPLFVDIPCHHITHTYFLWGK